MRFLHNIIALFFGVLLLFVAPQVKAQQDILVTQFAFNKMVLNPAYTGSRGLASVTALYRHQWMGFTGAPQTTSVSFQSPLKNNRLALGVHLTDDRIDVSLQTTVMGDFAYRIPVGKAQLSFGLEAGVIYQRLELGELGGVQPDDPLLITGQANWLPDFGAGIYLSAPRYFAGFSSKSLLDIDADIPGFDSGNWNTKRQYFAMLGYLAGNSKTIKFRPTTLLYYASGEQFQIDVNGSLLFLERFWVGGSYRSSYNLGSRKYNQSSVSANLEYFINMQMRVGYSYDYLLGALSTVSSGSHEIMLGFDFAFKQKNVVTPRILSPKMF